MDRAEKELGIFNIGPEFEFFLFQLSPDGLPSVKLDDHGSYFDMMPRSRAEAVKDRVCRWCDEIGFFVETYHHEVAPSQHEIDLCYGNALDIADRIMILKYLIRTAALKEGLFASFMPKPIAGVCGNGMHVHQSLITPVGKNIFADESKANGLSDIAMYYMGGLLEHATETCAIMNSSVNSYKRLVPGYEAPVYISWAFQNRSTLLRIPFIHMPKPMDAFKTRSNGTVGVEISIKLQLMIGCNQTVMGGIVHQMVPKTWKSL